MSVEFRQRKIGEYIKMMLDRKWLIIFPAIAVFASVFWVVRGLPNYYMSTSLLTLTPPTISEKVAPSLTDDDLSQRLQAINQTVLSRTSLEPLIMKFNLYEDDRAAGVPIERIVGRMENNIDVLPEKGNNEKVVGFRISFIDKSPEAAQDVTEELAEKYVTAQTVESTVSAETTREFINDQMTQAKANLDALEKQRLDIMTQNVETLPDSAQGLIAQLEGLRHRETTISKDKETLISEKGRIQDSIRAMNSQKRLIENFTQEETEQAIGQAARIEDTPAYAQLLQRKVEATTNLENLRKRYREKSREVVQARTEIEKIDEEIQKLQTTTTQRVKDANKAGSRKAQLQRESIEIDKEKAEGQISLIDGQLANKDREMAQVGSQIAMLETKINAIPNVKVALESVDNQYQMARSAYDEQLRKFNSAQQQVARETNEQGEKISVVDPANFPQTPLNASKRPFLIALGALFGLGLGLLLAAVLELPKLFTIQNVEDAKHYTGLPVLASVPDLLTDEEIMVQKRSNLLKIAAGFILAVVSVPVLVTVLQLTKIIERFG